MIKADDLDNAERLLHGLGYVAKESYRPKSGTDATITIWCRSYQGTDR